MASIMQPTIQMNFLGWKGFCILSMISQKYVNSVNPQNTMIFKETQFAIFNNNPW